MTNELRDGKLAQMYIPTQEERYAKRSIITLVLCFIAPSAAIAYLLQWSLVEMLTAFVLPLGLLLSYLGLPLYWWGLIVSLVLNAGLFIYIIKNKAWAGKTVTVIAITWGMFLALILKMMNAV